MAAATMAAMRIRRAARQLTLTITSTRYSTRMIRGPLANDPALPSGFETRVSVTEPAISYVAVRPSLVYSASLSVSRDVQCRNSGALYLYTLQRNAVSWLQHQLRPELCQNQLACPSIHWFRCVFCKPHCL